MMTRTATTSLIALLFALGCAPDDTQDTSRMLVGFELDAQDVYVMGPDGALELREDAAQQVAEPVLFAPRMCSLDEQAARLAGPDARDCGVIRLSDDPAPGEWCAAEAFALGEPFQLTYVIQGFEQRLERMISGNADGDVFVTMTVDRPCGASTCGPGYETTLCVAPRISEGGSIDCDAYRPLLLLLCE